MPVTVTGLHPIIMNLQNFGQNAEQLLDRFVLGMLSRVILRSPADSGFFRGSWDVTSGKGGAGSGVYEAILYNNAPYSVPIEYGSDRGGKPWPRVGPKTTLQGGRIWSSQAPGGVHGPAFEESNFNEFADALAALVTGG